MRRRLHGPEVTAPPKKYVAHKRRRKGNQSPVNGHLSIYPVARRLSSEIGDRAAIDDRFEDPRLWRAR
jgi:hypothetical protein